MGNGKAFRRAGRGDNDNFVRNNRIANAEGRNPGRPVFIAGLQLDGNDAVDASKQMLAGIAGDYHLFGAVFSVQLLERGPVLRFQDAERGSPISSVRPGHYVPLWLLERTFNSQNTGREENLDNQLVLEFLLQQPEAMTAWAEYQKEKLQAQVQNKLDALSVLRRPPKLTEISQILTANRGEIEVNGVNLLLGFGYSKDDGLPPVIITVTDAPPGHPMAVMVGSGEHRPVFVKQADLGRKATVDPDSSWLFQRSTELRLWLRKQLEDAGLEIEKILPPAPNRSTGVKVKAPQLNQITDLAHAWGTFTAEDGVTFLASYLGFGPQPKNMVIRVIESPEGHPMAEMKTKEVFALQAAIRYPADAPPRDDKVVQLTEKGHLAAELRTYLRELLRAAGYTFKTQPIAATQASEGSSEQAA